MLKSVKGNPYQTGYLGSVGNDKFGKMLIDCAHADDVHIRCSVSKNSTGICGVCLMDKERCTCLFICIFLLNLTPKISNVDQKPTLTLNLCIK